MSLKFLVRQFANTRLYGDVFDEAGYGPVLLRSLQLQAVIYLVIDAYRCHIVFYPSLSYYLRVMIKYDKLSYQLLRTSSNKYINIRYRIVMYRIG